MKICMLTTVHQPFDTRIFHKESKSLQKAGYTVTLIAPSDTTSKNIVDGIEVITIIKPDSKILHPITMLRVFIAGLRQDCDVYHCHEPGSLFVAIFLKILKKVKLIYDSHEYYPELIATDSLFPTIIRQILEKICLLEEKAMCNFPDIIITVDQVLAQYYKNINKNVYIISNYPILNISETDEYISRNPVIVYAGTLTKERGIFELIQAYEGVVKKIPEAKLLVIGGFVNDTFKKYIFEYIDYKMLSGVKFTGQISHPEVIEYLKNSAIGAIIHQPIARYKKAVPVKLFEYMINELAVVISDFKFNREIIQCTNCGIAIDPTDIKEITDTFIWLLTHPEDSKRMGRNGLKAVEETYNWVIEEKRLFEIYRKLE